MLSTGRCRERLASTLRVAVVRLTQEKSDNYVSRGCVSLAHHILKFYTINDFYGGVSQVHVFNFLAIYNSGE